MPTILSLNPLIFRSKAQAISLPIMPAILSDYSVDVYTRAMDIPDRVWDAFHKNPCDSNIMLPHAEMTRINETSGIHSHNLWIVCTAFHPHTSPLVDFVMSCTTGSLGSYPIFIFTTRHLSDLRSEDIKPRLVSMAHALLRSVPVERVFSVFAPELVARTFTRVWTTLTGIQLDSEPEYYAAKISYCTKSSFRPRQNSVFHDVEYELRLAREGDIAAAAQLCYGFALESPPFVLSMDDAVREASMMIDKRQLWVHEIRPRGQDPEIASIVAVTRTSSTVAAITKVYTNPRWRQRGCAERLTRKVCKHLLKTKDRVVLYVAHNNPAAAKVYHRVGFLGLGTPSEPVEGVDRWLELGLDRDQVTLGHW